MSHSVSVIIPAWNAQGTIRKCLESLRAQTVKPLEVFVIDDGSNDRTAEIAREYGSKLLQTGGRKGPATARNIGAEAASGDVLLFLDSDVIVGNELTEKMLRHFADHRIWAVQTLYSPVCPGSDPVTRYQNYYYYHSLNRMPEGSTATFATWCSAVLREKFTEIGGFNVRIPEPTVEDEELGYTIADSGGIIILDKSLLVTHLASYNLMQFTRRRMRMARAQAKSGWRQFRNRLLARYINVRESGTHHSRWVVLSILTVILAQLLIVASAVFASGKVLAAAAILFLIALILNGRFLAGAAKKLGFRFLPAFCFLCLFDMAVLGWGIMHGSLQYAMGKKY